LLAPEHNATLRNRILEKIMAEEWYPTFAIILAIATEAPSVILPDEEAKYGGLKHFQGFQATITVVKSCLYKARGDETANLIANQTLLQAWDSEIVNFGRSFLDKGQMLLLRDISGKRLMADVVLKLKEKFPESDFRRGAETAQDIFLSHWKVLEQKGINLTDKRAP
jgi:hypothetical protein